MKKNSRLRVVTWLVVSMTLLGMQCFYLGHLITQANIYLSLLAALAIPTSGFLYGKFILIPLLQDYKKKRAPKPPRPPVFQPQRNLVKEEYEHHSGRTTQDS